MNHRSSRRRRQKEKPWENTWGDKSWKLPENDEGNSYPSPRNPERPKQDKPKAKHAKTHINQINEDQTQRTNIKHYKGKTTNNTQRDPQKDNSWSFKRNTSGQKGMAEHTESDERIHVNPWLIHVNVWQKPLQYCNVISLELIKINETKKNLMLSNCDIG